MQVNDTSPGQADVIAAFDDRGDAEQALIQLRLAGFGDDRVGYYSRHIYGGMTNLLDRSAEFPGLIVGGVLGTALGVGVAYLLQPWSAAARDLTDPFGLVIICGVVGALFGGLIGALVGMGFTRSGPPAPAIDPAVAAFVLTVVAAGDDRERAWEIIRRNHGHDLPPGATMTHAAPTPVA
jgi:hypothetical protein